MTEAQHIPLVQQLAAIQVALQLFKDQIPHDQWEDTPLPIIAAPGAWLEEVHAFADGQPGDVVAELYGCKVAREDSLTEPVLIKHDGKTYKVSSFVEKITTVSEPAVVAPDAQKLN